MEVFDEGLPDDVIGVLKRGDVEVTFISASTSSISGKNFELVLWDDHRLHVVVADEYLDGPILNECLERIATRTDDGGLMPGEMQEIIANCLATALEEALAEVMDESFDKVNDLKIERTFQRLLEG